MVGESFTIYGVVSTPRWHWTHGQTDWRTDTQKWYDNIALCMPRACWRAVKSLTPGWPWYHHAYVIWYTWWTWGTPMRLRFGPKDQWAGSQVRGNGLAWVAFWDGLTIYSAARQSLYQALSRVCMLNVESCVQSMNMVSYNNHLLWYFR